MKSSEAWKNKNLESLCDEIWKEVDGYDGNFHVSSFGRIKSLKRHVFSGGKNRLRKERIICATLHRDGYIKCTIQSNGNRKTYMVHRLVAKTFIPNPENKPQINHKNGVKSDNTVENLEWCNASENGIHSYKLGLSKATHGELNWKSKLTKLQVIEIRNKYTGKHGEIVKMSREYNISASQIRRIVKNLRWKLITETD